MYTLPVPLLWASSSCDQFGWPSNFLMPHAHNTPSPVNLATLTVVPHLLPSARSHCRSVSFTAQRRKTHRPLCHLDPSAQIALVISRPPALVSPPLPFFSTSSILAGSRFLQPLHTPGVQATALQSAPPTYTVELPPAALTWTCTSTALHQHIRRPSALHPYRIATRTDATERPSTARRVSLASVCTLSSIFMSFHYSDSTIYCVEHLHFVLPTDAN